MLLQPPQPRLAFFPLLLSIKPLTPRRFTVKRFEKDASTDELGPGRRAGRCICAKNIWMAAGEGDLDRVKDCVEREGISPTAADEFTYTPLHAAASYGHLDILRYLLSHPSAPSDAVNVTDSDLDTPLFVCETVEAARCLIEEFHANAKHTNSEGLTAAQQAFENEHEDLAQYIASVTESRFKLNKKRRTCLARTRMAMQGRMVGR